MRRWSLQRRTDGATQNFNAHHRNSSQIEFNEMSSGETTAREGETVTTVDGEALDLSKAQAMSRRNTYCSPIRLPHPCLRG